MPSISELALGDIPQELQQTRRILERVPDGQYDWKPHDKSMSLGNLASHVAMLPGFAHLAISSDEIDFAKGMPPMPGSATNTADLLKLFDESSAILTKGISTANDAKFSEPWKMCYGPQVFFQGTRAAALRSMGISHIAHHRGQLSVYLRLLNVPVPGLYGPSADERGG